MQNYAPCRVPNTLGTPLCLANTKLCKDIQTPIENNNYDIWRKDRKGKNGGVVLMIKSMIKDINVEHGKEKPELISAQIKRKYGENQKSCCIMYRTFCLSVLVTLLHELQLSFT